MWGTGSYKIVVKDADDNEIETTDNITAFNATTTTNDGFFQSFSGDGATTSFTLSENLGTDEKALFINTELECSTNGGFSSDTGWTKGTGWTIAAGIATATGAISTALEQSAGLTLVQGRSYSIKYTITRSAGSITMSLGGTAGTARSASGTYSETIIAGSSQTISFGTSGFTGTLDNVSIVETGGQKILNPSFYTVDGTNLTLTIPPTTGTNNLEVRAPYTLIGAAGAAQVAADDAIAAAALAQGAVGAVAIKYTFDSTTSMADPGTGDFRLNNATIASATAISFDATCAETGNPDVSDIIAAIDASTNPVKGQVKITKAGSPATFAVFDITDITDNTGWLEAAVTYISGNGTLTNADVCYIQLTRAGNKGETGDAGATGSIGDIAGQTGATPASDDLGVFADITASNATRKATWADIVASTLLDEDDMSSDSATKAPTQQSVKAYVDAAGGGGGWVPIKTITASNDATIDFVNGTGGVVLDGTYKAYVVVISSGVPSVDGAQLRIRTSSNGGVSFDSGASDYANSGTYQTAGGAVNAYGGTDPQVAAALGLGNATGENFGGVIYLFNPAASAQFIFRGQIAYVDSGGTSGIAQFSGVRLANADVDGFRFYPNSGNITSGTFTLYGLASA